VGGACGEVGWEGVSGGRAAMDDDDGLSVPCLVCVRAENDDMIVD
jgi:hypothetical protein